MKGDATVIEHLNRVLANELDAILDLRPAIAYCEAHMDFVSRSLFDSISTSEGVKVDSLGTLFELIEKLGLQIISSHRLRDWSLGRTTCQ